MKRLAVAFAILIVILALVPVFGETKETGYGAPNDSRGSQLWDETRNELAVLKTRGKYLIMFGAVVNILILIAIAFRALDYNYKKRYHAAVSELKDIETKSRGFERKAAKLKDVVALQSMLLVRQNATLALSDLKIKRTCLDDLSFEPTTNGLLVVDTTKCPQRNAVFESIKCSGKFGRGDTMHGPSDITMPNLRRHLELEHWQEETSEDIGDERPTYSI